MSLSSWSSPPALPNHGFLLLAMAGCSQSKVALIFRDHLTAVLEFPGKAQRADWDMSPLMYVNLSPQKSAVWWPRMTHGAVFGQCSVPGEHLAPSKPQGS